MKVTFLLPGLKIRPGGGNLVIYRYANDLQRRGHQVQIVHPRRFEPARGFVPRAKAATWRVRKQIRYRGRPPWFDIDPAVEVVLAPDLCARNIPDADAVIGSDCRMARTVVGYERSKGEKLYLVQAYEDWSCGPEGVRRAWQLPLHKVVVSGWLFDEIAAAGERERETYVAPGIELDAFRIHIAPEDRNPSRVSMLAHSWSVKGLRFAVEALRDVRVAVPQLEVVAFGPAERPAGLPEWVEYVRQPRRHELVAMHNSAAIFLHSSLVEGWPMPPAEAMACGCALVASDSRGVRDYAVDGENALVAPPGNSAALASSLLELIADQRLRLRLAASGAQYIQKFDSSQSAARLESVIVEAVARGVSRAA